MPERLPEKWVRILDRDPVGRALLGEWSATTTEEARFAATMQVWAMVEHLEQNAEGE